MLTRFISAVASPLLCVTLATADSSDRVLIEVAGQVSPRCALDIPEPDINIEMDPERRTSASTPVLFDCNTPFVLSLRADEGALTKTDRFAQENPLVPHRIGYRATIDIPVELPQPSRLVATFSGEDLDGGRSIRSAGVARGAGRLSLTVQSNGSRLWSAGQYKEVIRIQIDPM